LVYDAARLCEPSPQLKMTKASSFLIKISRASPSRAGLVLRMEAADGLTSGLDNSHAADMKTFPCHRHHHALSKGAASVRAGWEGNGG